VVIDGGVDVVIAQGCLLVPLAGGGGPAVRTPAAAVRDTADLFDVQVHQRAGAVVFIAGGGVPARPDLLAGQRVAFGQARLVAAAQDARHGPLGHPGGRGDVGRSASQLSTACHHLVLQTGRGAVGDLMRAAGPVSQPGPALSVEPCHPPVRALP
jgi:hypothetical protein